jgi:hypothetical protein
MAKTGQEIENRMLTPVFTFKPKQPAPTFTRCGCGRPAAYEVYEDLQPHCEMCHAEAISTDKPVLVRRLQGGYDDAS